MFTKGTRVLTHCHLGVPESQVGKLPGFGFFGLLRRFDDSSRVNTCCGDFFFLEINLVMGWDGSGLAQMVKEFC